ncbi:31429_t:CDS:2 [Gigaspora margarita]|uniref:31429_t:CDS:1 n=1 Tax=Gigaspora margarita TaxID=4874 RepID=A0ABN7VAJ7_GIGMA|nr:31429_t:CDS:2 [Gigaspora margarita]
MVCNIEMVNGKAYDIKVKTAKPHNTTEQAIHDKAITEVIVVQNLLLSFTEEKMFKRFTKIIAYSHKGYLGITATWINENFELNNAVLVVTFLRYPYIADAIAKCIEDVLEYWNLKTKVFLITSNSRANMKSACNKLGVKWNKENIFLRAQSDVVTRWNSTYNAWVRMLELKPYIEILASSLTVQSERDAIEDGKQLKSIMITENEWTAVAGIINILKPFSDITNYISGSSYLTMSIIYPTISTLRNALLKEYVDEDISIYDTNEIDLNTDDISVFDLEEVSDEDEEFEQIRSPAAITNLVECIKNIMSELFERYYKFDDDKILFLAMAIDPRCKNFEYEGAILKGQDYLKLEYDQIISDEGLGSSSSKAALDLSGSFISTVFMAVQQNATHKNENQFGALRSNSLRSFAAL